MSPYKVQFLLCDERSSLMIKYTNDLEYNFDESCFSKHELLGNNDYERLKSFDSEIKKDFGMQFPENNLLENHLFEMNKALNVGSDPIKRVKLLEERDFQRIVPGTKIRP